MEGFLTTQHTGVAGLERGQLQCILIRLGTGVDEEQLIVVVTTDLTQALSQFHLKLIDDGVGIESNLMKLFGYLLNIMWMRMSDADHGMATIEVKIFLTILVPYLTALALYDIHVEERIYVE